MPWADVVPGAVRVQMDSSTTLVRGRKEFDWILTPVQPGSPGGAGHPVSVLQSVRRAVRGRVWHAVDSVTISGDPVVADRQRGGFEPGAADATHVGRRGAGAHHGLAALLVAHRDGAAAVGVRSRCGRRTRVRCGPRRRRRRLRRATREGGADAALVRRIFARAVAERVHLAPTEMTDQDTLRRALRRAGVSEPTAADAASLLARLDESVFGGGAFDDPANPERAIVLLRAIDEEARSRAAIAARTRQARRGRDARSSRSASATALAATQDVVASHGLSDGLAAYDAREFGSARQAFFELAQARPRAADAWYNFATASWQLEDTAAAVIGWQRAMRLDPMTTGRAFAPATRPGNTADCGTVCRRCR